MNISSQDEQLKESLKPRLREYLDRITEKRGANTYNCPLPECRSGTGRNHTPACSISKEGDKWNCFSCNHGGDIFTLVALMNNLDPKGDFPKVLELTAAEFGITIDKGDNMENKQYTHNTHNKQTTQYKHQTENTAKEVDYSKFLADCKANSGNENAVKYFTSRELDSSTVERFNLGYVTAETLNKYKAACKLPNYITSGDIMIPYNDRGTYWIARDTQTMPNEKKEKGLKWKKPQTEIAGTEPVFNEVELDTQSREPIFITEAPLDTISVIQAGGAGIATGGTGTNRLMTAIDCRRDFNRPLIIAFDNDKAGKEAATNVSKELEGRNKVFVNFEYPEGIKDCNAYLIADKAGFYRAVEHSIEAAKKAAAEAEREEREKAEAEFDAYNAGNRLRTFDDTIRNHSMPPIPTGYKSLDKLLDGGLREGLYIIGAISSLGKTTFVLQMADQIASNYLGNDFRDVIIFSLEMSAVELMAKSISRETYRYCKENEIGLNRAKSKNGITDGCRYKDYYPEDLEVIKAAEERYSRYAQQIYVKEGEGNIDPQEVRHTVEMYEKAYGNKPHYKPPIVIVDYLQIMAPEDERASDKQNTDRAVTELKHISRDYKIPVIVISSFNRENYNTAVSMTAFKESGAIEYSSDVLIGLQPVGMKELKSDGEKEEKNTKAANRAIINQCKNGNDGETDVTKKYIRNLEAVVLKNRNGATGGKAVFSYNCVFNIFEEGTDKEEPRTRGTVEI